MEGDCKGMLVSDESKISEVTDSTPSNPPSFENVLEELGVFGKFQMHQLTFGFLGSFMTGFMAMSFVFLGHEPTHVCNTVNETELLSGHGLENNSTRISYDSCDIRISANRSGSFHDILTLICPKGRSFYNAEHSTFLSEWDLVCESMGQAEISHLIFTGGQLAGGLIISTVADLIGRKPVLTFTSFFAFVTEVAVIFAPNIFAVYGVRFFSGLFFQGLNCCFFVHGMELVLPKHRQKYGVVICMIWVFQVSLVGLVAYLLQDYSWRYFQGATAASGIMFFFYPLFLYESPRWLAVRCRFKESLQILKKASEMNGKNFERVEAAFNAYAAHHSKTTLDNTFSNLKENGRCNGFRGPNNKLKMRKDSVVTLLSHRKFIVMTLAAWYMWITHNMTYYGLYMTSSTLVGNRFLNFTLMALVEIPSNLLILLTMSKMSRRLVLRIFLTMAAFCLLASTLLTSFNSSGSHSILSTALFVGGKFAISASFNVLYIVTPEIFPTSIRVSGSGSCTSIDKIGSMVAPFLRPLSTILPWGPGVIFTVMCVVALCLTPLLPETKNTNLPSTLNDTKLSETTDTDSDSLGDGEDTV